MTSLPQDIRFTIYSFLDLMSLVRKASRVCKHDNEHLPTSKILTQKRSLLVTMNGDQLVYDQLWYCVKLSSKVDLRVLNFEQKDQFTLGVIVGLCQEFQKKIELNIWVDKDLDVKLFVSSFRPQIYHKLIDFIYYRFDFGNQSSKLRGLMSAFHKVKSVQFAQQSDAYIRPDDIQTTEHCEKLKITSQSNQNFMAVQKKFPNLKALTAKF